MKLAMSTEQMFIRELEVDSLMCTVKIAQMYVGDVGTVVWDAGIALAKYLDFNNNKGYSLKNKRIIELGSGTGVVGLFAAVLGGDTILTDLPELMCLLQNNIEWNKDIITGSAVAQVLQWGEPFCIPQPDIILIADCVYYEESIKGLLKTILELKGEHTELLISYEERTSENKKEILDEFFNILKESFDIITISSNDQHPQYQSSDIHLLKCTSFKP